jgi:hypothetical protein
MEEVRNQFRLDIYDDRLKIHRDSSSFVDFYEWYRRFMPEAQSLVSTVKRAIERKSERELSFVQTQFEFKINFSDFISTGRNPANRQTRNVDVLQTIIPAIPDSRGFTELSRQNFYRLDVNFSRLEEFNVAGISKSRNCWYILEAPFNEKGRFILLTAQLRNSSFDRLNESNERGGTVRSPFDDDFAGDYFIALDSFLKGSALETYMGRLLATWDFKTQRQL